MFFFIISLFFYTHFKFSSLNNNEHKPIESLRNHDTDGNKNVTKNRFLLACEQASFWGIARDLT